ERDLIGIPAEGKSVRYKLGFTAYGLDHSVKFVVYKVLQIANQAAAVTLSHCKCAVQQVAEIICQLRVEKSNQPALVKVGIVPHCDTSHQIIAQRVCVVFICEREWIDNVASTFAHLRATKIPPAVHEKLRDLVVRKSDGMQHD